MVHSSPRLSPVFDATGLCNRDFCFSPRENTCSLDFFFPVCSRHSCIVPGVFPRDASPACGTDFCRHLINVVRVQSWFFSGVLGDLLIEAQPRLSAFWSLDNPRQRRTAPNLQKLEISSFSLSLPHQRSLWIWPLGDAINAKNVIGDKPTLAAFMAKEKVLTCSKENLDNSSSERLGIHISQPYSIY